MKSKVGKIGIFVIAFIMVASAKGQQAVQPDEPHYTGAQIKRMVRDARTAEDYTTLADYYAVRQRMFKQKAAEEMHLWAMRSAMVNPVSEKWPRPVDSARNLHDYYEYKANEAAQLQAKNGQLADQALR